jgi:hypothetical protein
MVRPLVGEVRSQPRPPRCSYPSGNGLVGRVIHVGDARNARGVHTPVHTSESGDIRDRESAMGRGASPGTHPARGADTSLFRTRLNAPAVALNGLGVVRAWFGDLEAAAGHVAEFDVIKDATGIGWFPAGGLEQAAYQASPIPARPVTRLPGWRAPRQRMRPRSDRGRCRGSQSSKSRTPNRFRARAPRHESP